MHPAPETGTRTGQSQQQQKVRLLAVYKPPAKPGAHPSGCKADRYAGVDWHKVQNTTSNIDQQVRPPEIANHTGE